jgi:hypothetical protein
MKCEWDIREEKGLIVAHNFIFSDRYNASALKFGGQSFKGARAMVREGQKKLRIF